MRRLCGAPDPTDDDTMSNAGVPWQQRVHTVAQLPAKVTHLLANHPWLESPVLSTMVLSTGALVLAAWTARAVWERRHHTLVEHRIARRLVLSGVSSLLVVTGTGLAVNSYVGYVPSISALQSTVGTSVDVPAALVPAIGVVGTTPRHPLASGDYRHAHVVVLRVPVGGPHGGRRPVEVYLPQGYADPRNATRRYPVVYLLHGFPGRAVDWIDGGGLIGTADTLTQHGLIPPMIIVMPQVARSPFTDSECLNLPGGEQDETFLTTRSPARWTPRSVRRPRGPVGRSAA